LQDADSGEIRLCEAAWRVTRAEMRYMPVYQRAHELMPEPRSPFLSPDEYADELGPAVVLLEKTEAGERTEADDVLRALAILGHTPRPESIRALSRFSESDHSLSPVAGLALGECTGLFSLFNSKGQKQSASFPGRGALNA
jgi:hypothetical protein